MHLHLDPIGGVAGDMFTAALLDTWPELEQELIAALRTAGVLQLVTVKRLDHRDHALSGSKYQVTQVPAQHDHHHEHEQHHHHPHRPFRVVRELLQSWPLSDAVKQHALGIFSLLADAEARVHDMPVDEVEFHEVGAWDSIADVVSAAWLIDKLASSWSCSALPAGSGRVNSAHGVLPLPAPATALLLEGYPLYQDGLEGERITPTGAAILRYLNPSFAAQKTPYLLSRNGIGFGNKTFPGLSNILRVLVYEPVSDTVVDDQDQVGICQFEIDDQTAEDLAVALERLRSLPEVLDIIQIPVLAKKNRFASQIQILTQPQALEQVIEQCFVQTSTLGIRWQISQRKILPRTLSSQELAGHTVHIKQAQRPDGSVTVKAEMDDIAKLSEGRAQRERLRRQAEQDNHD